MHFCRLSLSSSLVFASFDFPQERALFECIPDEIIYLIQQDLTTDMSLQATSSRFRRLLSTAKWSKSKFALNRVFSRRYIYDEEFRQIANATRSNARQRIRLNLGEDFREYMTNSDYRAHIDVLVANPCAQIWSDVDSLDLSFSFLENISPVAGLVNLRRLNLWGTLVQDIGALAGLVNLRQLDLSDTPVWDISPLAGLGNLHTLSLGRTQVQDISALAKLGNLHRLNLWSTPLRDVSALRGSVNLQILDLRYTQLQDISPLAALGNLRTLDLWGTQLGDTSALAALVNLRIYQ